MTPISCTPSSLVLLGHARKRGRVQMGASGGGGVRDGATNRCPSTGLLRRLGVALGRAGVSPDVAACFAAGYAAGARMQRECVVDIPATWPRAAPSTGDARAPAPAAATRPPFVLSPTAREWVPGSAVLRPRRSHRGSGAAARRATKRAADPAVKAKAAARAQLPFTGTVVPAAAPGAAASGTAGSVAASEDSANSAAYESGGTCVYNATATADEAACHSARHCRTVLQRLSDGSSAVTGLGSLPGTQQLLGEDASAAPCTAGSTLPVRS